MISSVKPTLKIAHITHTTEQTYEIISIHGLPFYQSSGQQSNFANTWFPFFGLLENNKTSLYREGWFIKSLETKLPHSIYQILMKLFPGYGSDAPGGRELLLRFWNTPCLLLSSSLGGGLWEDAKGKELKDFLLKEYPDFYQQIPTFEIMPASQPISSHLEVNQWLCKQAKITDYNILKSQFPLTVPDLCKHLDNSAKPILTPTVAVKKVRFAQNIKNPTKIAREKKHKRGRGSRSVLHAILLGLGRVIFTITGWLHYYSDRLFKRQDLKKPERPNSSANHVNTELATTANSAETFLPSVTATEPVPIANVNNRPSPLKGILKRR